MQSSEDASSVWNMTPMTGIFPHANVRAKLVEQNHQKNFLQVDSKFSQQSRPNQNRVWTIQVVCDGNDSQHHNRDVHPDFHKCHNLKSQFRSLPASDITQGFLIRLVNYDDIQLYMTNRLMKNTCKELKL